MMSPFEVLESAIEANDPARARDVLTRHPELRSRMNDPMPHAAFGATPLLTAMPWANREMIDLLLDAGADINGRSHWWAGSFGVLDDDRGLAPYLIERGAVVDVNAASKLGMLDRLAELIAADPALVSHRGGDGQTPLHVACSAEVALFLLEHRAEIDARDIDHESTPAQYMVRDRQEIARELVARGAQTDLLMAAALGDIERVRRHLDQDPACIRMNVSEEWFPKRDPRSGGCIYIWALGSFKTAHLVAREFGHEEIFDLLMERSPEELKLSLACELGERSAFEALLERRPDLVRTLPEADQRKLANAAQNHNTEAVRRMLEAGWPVDVRGEMGATPLHWASWHGNREMVIAILRHHPLLEVRDRSHDGTPLDWALHGSLHGWHSKSGDYAGVVDALLAAGAKPRDDELKGSDAALAAIRRYVEERRRSG